MPPHLFPVLVPAVVGEGSFRGGRQGCKTGGDTEGVAGGRERQKQAPKAARPRGHEVHEGHEAKKVTNTKATKAMKDTKASTGRAGHMPPTWRGDWEGEASPIKSSLKKHKHVSDA